MCRFALSDARGDGVQMTTPGFVDQVEEGLGPEGVEQFVVEHHPQPGAIVAEVDEQNTQVVGGALEWGVDMLREESIRRIVRMGGQLCDR